MTNDRRLAQELSVCRAAIKAALARNLVVSVNDGGEWVVKKSDKLNEIISALRSTCEDTVVFRHAKDGARVGFMQFVYGNMPYEVIADFTDNELMDDIYREAEIVANRVEARC